MGRAVRSGATCKESASVAGHAIHTEDGIQLATGTQHWRLTVRAFGYGQNLHPAPAAKPTYNANRIEYQRGSLSEWYVNSPAGLEQGFTIAKRPSFASKGDPLTIAMQLSGSLAPALESGTLTLQDRDGRSLLRYTGLAAWDARGHELKSWMELADRELRLRVDDREAVYPVVIDPYIQQAKLSASDAQLNASLGFSVAVSADGNSIVAGAPGDNGRAGAAYVFVKSGPYWTDGAQVAKLTPFDGAALNQFGVSVGMSGDGNTIVVGSHPSYVGASGWAYVFEKPAGGWKSTSAASVKFTPSDEAGNYFTSAISLSHDGSTLAIGAPNSGSNRGAVYIYVRPANGWATATEFNAKITSFDGGGIDQFGRTVALSSDGETLAVGAPGVNLGRGAVYTYYKNTPPWASRSDYASKLTASSASENDGLGTSLAITADGNTVVAGATNSSSGFGAAYVFVAQGGLWYDMNETATLTVSPGGGAFGVSVATNHDGSFVLVGQDLNRQAFGFRKPGSGWVSTSQPSATMLPGGTEYGGRFGHAVALSRDGLLAVTGAYEATIGTAVRAGAVYVSQSAERATQSVTSLYFGSYPVGAVSQPQAVTLTNNAPAGSAPLRISSMSRPAAFSVTNNCIPASPLAVGASCTEYVTFSPVAIGPASANLQIVIDSSAINVALSGTGAKAGSTTSITAIAPSRANVGQPVTFAFSVVGQGETATLSGTVTVSASTGERCTGTAPSGQCSIAFATAGTRTLTATYAGNANYDDSASSGISYTVDAVQGGSFSIATLPSSITLPLPVPATFLVTLTPTQGFTGTVELTCTSPSANSSCSVLPRQVQLSKSLPTLALVTAKMPRQSSGTFSISATGAGVTRSTQVKLTVR